MYGLAEVDEDEGEDEEELVVPSVREPTRYKGGFGASS